MRALILGLAAMCLAACGVTSGGLSTAPPILTGGPVVVADSTTLDETAGRSIELAYKAARMAMETAVDAGLLKGERAAQAQVINRRAYDAVLTARAAYRTGNSASWITASAEARRTIESLLALVNRSQ